MREDSPVNKNEQWFQPWFPSGAGFGPSTVAMTYRRKLIVVWEPMLPIPVCRGPGMVQVAELWVSLSGNSAWATWLLELGRWRNAVKHWKSEAVSFSCLACFISVWPLVGHAV